MTGYTRKLARALIASTLKPVSLAQNRRLAMQLEEALNREEPAEEPVAEDDSMQRFKLVEIE